MSACFPFRRAFSTDGARRNPTPPPARKRSACWSSSLSRKSERLENECFPDKEAFVAFSYAFVAK